jgi:hypothetical protein
MQRVAQPLAAAWAGGAPPQQAGRQLAGGSKGREQAALVDLLQPAPVCLLVLPAVGELHPAVLGAGAAPALRAQHSSAA